jgi:hypothetical protein
MSTRSPGKGSPTADGSRRDWTRWTSKMVHVTGARQFRWAPPVLLSALARQCHDGVGEAPQRGGRGRSANDELPCAVLRAARVAHRPSIAWAGRRVSWTELATLPSRARTSGSKAVRSR